MNVGHALKALWAGALPAFARNRGLAAEARTGLEVHGGPSSLGDLDPGQQGLRDLSRNRRATCERTTQIVNWPVLEVRLVLAPNHRHNCHTIQLNFAEASSLALRRQVHAAAVHSIGRANIDRGKIFLGKPHFRHRSESGALACSPACCWRPHANPRFSRCRDHAGRGGPALQGGPSSTSNTLLPPARYYCYPGSLTTPPFSRKSSSGCC